MQQVSDLKQSCMHPIVLKINLTCSAKFSIDFESTKYIPLSEILNSTVFKTFNIAFLLF